MFKLKRDTKKRLHHTQGIQGNEILFYWKVTHKLAGKTGLLHWKISGRQLGERIITANFTSFVEYCFNALALILEITITFCL